MVIFWRRVTPREWFISRTSRRGNRSGNAVRLEGAISQQALAFSSDGGSLAAATATGGDKANLYLVDVLSRTARHVASWPSVPANVGPLRFTHMAFSPDGTRIAVAVASASPTSLVPIAQRLVLLEAKRGRVVWERKYPLGNALNEAAVAFTPQRRPRDVGPERADVAVGYEERTDPAAPALRRPVRPFARRPPRGCCPEQPERRRSQRENGGARPPDWPTPLSGGSACQSLDSRLAVHAERRERHRGRLRRRAQGVEPRVRHDCPDLPGWIERGCHAERAHRPIRGSRMGSLG